MNYLLFTTTRCPKCPEFKKFIQDKVNIEGRILDETMGDFPELVQTHNASSAPLFIVFDSHDQEVFRSDEMYEIQEFLGLL